MPRLEELPCGVIQRQLSYRALGSTTRRPTLTGSDATNSGFSVAVTIGTSFAADPLAHRGRR